MGLKRTENRQVIPQHIKFLDLKELKWNYGVISKTGQNQGIEVQVPIFGGWDLLM